MKNVESMAPRLPRSRAKSRIQALLAGVVLVLCAGQSLALNRDLIVLRCTNCNTTSEFVNFALQWAVGAARPGLYVVSSEAQPRTAYVSVTGTVKQRCSRFEACETSLVNAAAVSVDDVGTPTTLDSVLEQNDEKLFGTNRAKPIAPVRVPAEYGMSFRNNPSMAEDTSTAICNELYVNRGIWAGDKTVQHGTIVTVIWPDGTRAKFVRAMMAGSYQWAYIPGTARDKYGNRLSESGAIIGNNNTSGRGEGQTSLGPTAEWGLEVRGGDRCVTTTTIYWRGLNYGSYTSYLPC